MKTPNRTGITWLDYCWNVTSGCTATSPGCEHCYSERISKRFKSDWNKIQLHHDRLAAFKPPREPSRIGICLMSDLFHEDVPVEFLQDVFSVITLYPQHEFFVLTKRAERMREIMQHDFLRVSRTDTWPLPSLWLGVSVCTKKELALVETLRATPAAHRFISFEPLLEDVGDFNLEDIDWVVAGCESGSNRRPSEPIWFRNIELRCMYFRVEYFLKQEEINGKVVHYQMEKK